MRQMRQMRWMLLVCAVGLSACIADRIPSADDDERASPTPDARPPDGWIDDAQVEPIDDARVERPDAAPDFGLDAQVDAAPMPDAAIPQCERVFGASPWVRASSPMHAGGRFVAWEDEDRRLTWFDASREPQRVPAETSVRAQGIGLNHVISQARNRLVIVDLETAEVLEINGHNYGIGGGDGWITWALPDGVFARSPDGRVLRLNDCVRNCEPPLKTADALWTIGRARGEVEPVLYRHPLDGGDPQILFGPIRDLALTTGGETVHWWTISNPPVGDRGRQVIAAGTERVPFRSDPDRPPPAWFEGTNISAFSVPEGLVLVYPEGREVLLEAAAPSRAVSAGGMLVLPLAAETQIMDPTTLETVLSLPGGQFQREPGQHAGRALFSVRYGATTDLIAVGGGRAELLMRAPLWITRFEISPDARHIVATGRGQSDFDVNTFTVVLHDLQDGQTRMIEQASTAERIVWMDSTHLGWVDRDGALHSYSVEGAHFALPGPYEAVRSLGRAADGCSMIALQRVVGEQGFDRLYEISRQPMPLR